MNPEDLILRLFESTKDLAFGIDEMMRSTVASRPTPIQVKLVSMSRDTHHALLKICRRRALSRGEREKARAAGLIHLPVRRK